MNRKFIIAVIGDASVEPNDPRDRFAEELGRRIIDQGWHLQTGGLGGVMEAASRGGRTSENWSSGSIIGILPGWDPARANPYVDVPLPTGLGHGRNLLVAQADAVVAVGGGAGTLSEMAMAWMLHRLVLARRGEGWAGRLADQHIDERVRFPDIPDDRVFGVDTAQEAIGILEQKLSAYQKRHTGLR
jgi:uncharacterized protein (TIGR00725 family)